MMDTETRFEAAQSGEGPEGCTDASAGDLATRCTSNEAAAPEKGDKFLLQLNEGWRLAHDGSLQWILQRRMSKLGKPAKWGDRFSIKGWPPRYRSDFSGWVADTTLLPMAAE